MTNPTNIVTFYFSSYEITCQMYLSFLNAQEQNAGSNQNFDPNESNLSTPKNGAQQLNYGDRCKFELDWKQKVTCRGYKRGKKLGYSRQMPILKTVYF